ncbi:MAG: efflux transporter outer membrane subunit [Rhodoferax sp.]
MPFLNLSPRRGDRTLALQALALAALGTLSACANLPEPGKHPAPLDATQLGLPAAAPTAAGAEIDAQWWRAFGDAQLNQWIEQATANHPSLRVAQARLERVRAQSAVLEAADGPQANANLDLTRQLFTSTGMYPPPLAGTVRETGTLQASGSWELDFFGKNRAAIEAALGQVHAAEADAQAAQMLLASNVARSYFQLLRITAQREVAQRSLAQREQMLALVRSRVDAGLDTPLELRQSEGTLPEARLQLEQLQEQEQLTRNGLAALVAQPKQRLASTLPALAALQPISVPRSMPLDLLARRADIAAARQRVLAAQSDVENARAQFYPNINLVAFAGLSSIGFDRLFDAGSQQWGVGPALRLPLFDGGRLRAQLRGRNADLDGAIASYNALVIDAVREAADQLASLQSIARQQAEQAQTQAKAEATHAIAAQRFQAGLATAMQVLAAESAVLAQRRLGVDLTARALDCQVQLIRALGGGYRDPSPDLAHAP